MFDLYVYVCISVIKCNINEKIFSCDLMVLDLKNKIDCFYIILHDRIVDVDLTKPFDEIINQIQDIVKNKLSIFNYTSTLSFSTFFRSN